MAKASAMPSRWATPSSRKRSSSSHGAEMLRLWVGVGGIQRGCAAFGDHPHPADRGVPQAAQHVPLRAGQSRAISIRRPTRCRADQLQEIDQWILLRAEDLVARCRAWYDEFAFHKVYHAIYDFATVDLSSIYFDVLKDRLYTSARRNRRRGAARRRRSTGSPTRWCACWRRILASPRKKSGRTWAARRSRQRPHGAISRKPGELTAGHRPEDAAETRSQLGPSDGSEEDVLKSLETARKEKFIGAPLEARVACPPTAICIRCWSSTRRELPALFIVSQVALRAGPAMAERRSASGARRRRQVRALLEIHDGRRITA